MLAETVQPNCTQSDGWEERTGTQLSASVQGRISHYVTAALPQSPCQSPANVTFTEYSICTESETRLCAPVDTIPHHLQQEEHMLASEERADTMVADTDQTSKYRDKKSQLDEKRGRPMGVLIDLDKDYDMYCLGGDAEESECDTAYAQFQRTSVGSERLSQDHEVYDVTESATREGLPKVPSMIYLNPNCPMDSQSQTNSTDTRNNRAAASMSLRRKLVHAFSATFRRSNQSKIDDSKSRLSDDDTEAYMQTLLPV